MKSKAAYTNKWLNRNRHLWEERKSCGIDLIFLKTECAPKVVRERVKEINESRRRKSDEILISNLVDLAFNDKPKWPRIIKWGK